jgi:hypothetical protein
VTFLLAAFIAGSSVEVFFGGGCNGGLNWIQTIRLAKLVDAFSKR